MNLFNSIDYDNLKSIDLHSICFPFFFSVFLSVFQTLLTVNCGHIRWLRIQFLIYYLDFCFPLSYADLTILYNFCGFRLSFNPVFEIALVRKGHTHTHKRIFSLCSRWWKNEMKWNEILIFHSGSEFANLINSIKVNCIQFLLQKQKLHLHMMQHKLC